MQEGVNEYIAAISPIDAGDIATPRMVKLDEPQPNLISSWKEVVDASGDGLAELGEILTYTLTISNAGDSGAGLVLTDTLPTGLTYVDGSLQVDFPGAGFTAMVADDVVMAHTSGHLSPPEGSALPADGAAVVVYACQMSGQPPGGDSLTNFLELRDQFAVYRIAPAVIPLQPSYEVFLPMIVRDHATPRP
jgi:uncharacterized repeat protein (TIGR01451 family)